MNAYELATNLDAESSQMEYGYVVDDFELLSNAATMLRQQADRIAELEKDLHMVQRHYDQLELPEGYVVVCVHCAKELKIEFDEQNDLEAKMAKYEQVLQSIANEHIELSHDKIKWQCEDHIRWAKEALSSSGNNDDDMSKTNETLPKGKE